MPNIAQILSGNLGAPQAIPGGSPLSGAFPWGSSSPTPFNSVFFPPLNPDGSLWDKLVPYRLVVMDVTQNPPKVVNGNQPSEISVSPLGNGTLAFTPLSTAWEFLLPITPQQLSITDNFAINTSATLRGVLEEHSGVRFKNISIQGTFGVWPGRPAIASAPTNAAGASGALQSIFGGTIASAQNVATQFKSILNNANSGTSSAKPITVRPGDPKDPEHGLGTGYYQTLMLAQFLEQYTEAKRNPKNAGWRLIFDIPKQNQSFVVTPLGFTWNENVNRPMEVNYSLQMKAWRRIDLDDQFVPAPLNVTPLSPGVLQQIVNTISAAQNTAAASVNLIGSVRSDVDGVLNTIRQTGLLVKGIAGVALAAIDLPAQLLLDCESTINQFVSTLNPNNLVGPSATNSIVADYVTSVKNLSSNNEGLSQQAVSSGQLGGSAAASLVLNQSKTIFENPLQYPLLFNQIPVNNLILNSAQQNALQTEINNVNSLTVADLKTMRADILNLTTQLANSFGAGNAYYSTLFNQPAPIFRSEPMTLDEFAILKSFYDLIQSYDILTATNQLDNEQMLNSLEYVNALAQTSNIEFSISNSKIQVPVPFGLNIEQIAMRYLGDPQRWLEVATLNELREPYIDENGFQYQLLSNADGRNIVVGNNTDLFIGQTVFINSNTQNATARKIINIVQLSQTSFLLTLDGLANLSVFKLSDQAYIQAYLPGTVNSENVIWMPSDLPAPADDGISIPSSVSNIDLVGLSKVDWLLNQYGDIAIDNSGSFRLAAGLPNLIQALTLKFSTPLGTSLLNPDFGLSVQPGKMVSDTSAGDIYKQIVKMITADPRFSGVSGLQVNVTPPAVNISLGIGLAGMRGIFPVSFQLPTTN